MINFVSAEEFGKKQSDSKDFLLKFNDSEINKTQFLFVKEQLGNYNRYMNSEYKITLDTKYNDSKNKLDIELVITIPDCLIPYNDEKLVELWIDLEKGFLKFYEQDIEPFKP